MTTIRTTCPRCGEVDMGPESIVLSIRDELDGEGVYSFVCPLCREDVEKQADQKIVALLRSAGVCMAEGGVSSVIPSIDAPSEDVSTLGLTPLSLDDVIQFHFLLQEDAYLEKFLADH